MHIQNLTIEYYAGQGIEVKNHPGTFAEYRQTVWQKEYDWAYQYDAMMDIRDPETGQWRKLNHEELDAKAKDWADRNTDRKVRDWYNAEYLYIEYADNGNRRLICQKVATKSKEITPEYIDRLIAKDKKTYSGTFGKFADNMNRLIKSAGYERDFSVYPTTYGIGVWVFYNWQASKNIADVEHILKSNGIEYSNEYSKAYWVYRFKISKQQANLALIEAV